MTNTMSDPAVRNGVDTATLFATIDAVKDDNEIAKFQFRATNRWVNGTHNHSTIHRFYGAKQEMEHQQPWRSTPITPRCSSATTTGRRRSSTCCTPSPPA